MSGHDDHVVEALAVSVLGVGTAWWGGSWLASLVFDQGLLRAGVGPAWHALVALPNHLGDPRAAWPERYAKHLPGPVPYWLSCVAAVAITALVWSGAKALSSHVGQEKRRRLGQRVRGRFALRRETVTLAVPTGDVPPGRFLLGEMARPWWKCWFDPRGPRWLATEWRAQAETETVPWWRPWRRHWIKKHRFDRGAVAVIGPSRSGKSALVSAACFEWHNGPMIVSSVKADVYASVSPVRNTRGDTVKVFDPFGIVEMTGGERGSWSPVKPGMTFSECMQSASALVAGYRAESTGASDNDQFFTTQSQLLLTGLIWLASWTDYRLASIERPQGGMAQVAGWVRAGKWESAEGGYDGLDLVFDDLYGVEGVDHADFVKARDLITNVLVGMADQTRGGVLGNAANIVMPWTNPSIELNASTCDLTLEWLLGDDQDDETRRAHPRSLFLSATASDMRMYGPVFAGALNKLILEITERFMRTGKPLDPPLLLVIDEAGQTPIPALPEYAATLAGMGVQIVTVWQSVAQMKAAFGPKTDGLLANHLSKLVFAAQSDKETLDTFAFLLGEEEVLTYSGTDSRSDERDSQQTSSTLTSMAPTTIMRQMRVGDAVMIHGTLPPIWLRTFKWWRDPRFKRYAELIARTAPVTAPAAVAVGVDDVEAVEGVRAA